MFRLFNLIWRVEHEQHVARQQQQSQTPDTDDDTDADAAASAVGAGAAELEALRREYLTSSPDETAARRSKAGGKTTATTPVKDGDDEELESIYFFEESACEAFVYEVVAMGHDLGTCSVSHQAASGAVFLSFARFFCHFLGARCRGRSIVVLYRVTPALVCLC